MVKVLQGQGIRQTELKLILIMNTICVLTENLRGSSQTLMADNFIHLGVN